MASDFIEVMLKSGRDLMQRFTSKTDLGKRIEDGKDLTGRFISKTDPGKRITGGKDLTARETDKKGFRR